MEVETHTDKAQDMHVQMDIGKCTWRWMDIGKRPTQEHRQEADTRAGARADGHRQEADTRARADGHRQVRCERAT
jgi:hypothetical protein